MSSLSALALAVILSNSIQVRREPELVLFHGWTADGKFAAYTLRTDVTRPGEDIHYEAFTWVQDARTGEKTKYELREAEPNPAGFPIVPGKAADARPVAQLTAWLEAHPLTATKPAIAGQRARP